jgi:hypothetical protein
MLLFVVVDGGCWMAAVGNALTVKSYQKTKPVLSYRLWRLG